MMQAIGDGDTVSPDTHEDSDGDDKRLYWQVPM